ncbi:MAG: hypothetical protein AAF917_07115 [Pseudomonadota bacterium]
MHTRLSALILAALLTLNLHAAGPDYAKLVNASFDGILWDLDDNYAFTETQMSGDTRTVARFDPSAPEGEQWTLLSYDNRPPSLEETEAFVDEKSWRRGPDTGGTDGIIKLIDTTTLTLLEASGDYWLLSFKPTVNIDDSDDLAFLQDMIGELRINRESGHIDYVDIRNSRAIRPVIGTKIQSMVMRFEFTELGDNGPRVLSHVSAGAKGSALLVVRFNELERFDFSDFAYVGD